MRILLCFVIIFCALMTACMQELPEATATPEITKRVIPTAVSTPSPTPVLPLLTPSVSLSQVPDLELILLERNPGEAIIVLNLSDNSVDLVKSISVKCINNNGSPINFLPLSQEDTAAYETEYLIGIFYAVKVDVAQEGIYAFSIDITLTDNTVLPWESVISIS